MRADTAAPNHDDERLSQLLQTLGLQEHAISRQLLQYELLIKVASLCAPRQCLVSRVLLVDGATEAVELQEALASAPASFLRAAPSHYLFNLMIVFHQ